jgi:hypothetical protein
MRRITIMSGIRETMADVEIRGADQTIIQKEELVSPRAQNHDDSTKMNSPTLGLMHINLTDLGALIVESAFTI